MILRNFSIILFLLIPTLNWSQTPNSNANKQIVIPNGIYLLSQPYHFQLDTISTYIVKFDNRNIEISSKNEFVINSYKPRGELKVYRLADYDTNLVLDQKLRFYPPNFTVLGFRGKHSGDTIKKEDLNYPFISVELLNYDLGVHFTAKKVKLKIINYFGETKDFEFEGYEIPIDIQAYLHAMTKGILVFDITIQIGQFSYSPSLGIYYMDNVPAVDSNMLCDFNVILQCIRSEKLSIIDSNFSKLIFENKDDCVLLFFKLVFDNYVNAHSERSFKVLSSISCQFDGYISEYFYFKLDEIFASKKLKELFLSELFSENLERKPSKSCLKELTELYIQVYNPKAIDDIILSNKSKDYLNFISELKRKQ